MENLNRQNKKLTQSLIKRGVDPNNFVRVQDLIPLINELEEVIASLGPYVETVTGTSVDNRDPLNPVISTTGGSILKKTFVLTGAEIETLDAGINLEIDADANAVCIPVAILFDYELNGGVGTVWSVLGKLRLSGGAGNFAIADGQNFEVSDNINRSFRLYDENGYDYGTAYIWTNNYDLASTEVITSSDPLTTLTIDFFYILR